MAEVPISPAMLEELAVQTSIGLLEEWAIQGRIPAGKEEEYASLAVEDALFVINSFMENFNNAMNQAKVSQLEIK